MFNNFKEVINSLIKRVDHNQEIIESQQELILKLQQQLEKLRGDLVSNSEEIKHLTLILENPHLFINPLIDKKS